MGNPSLRLYSAYMCPYALRTRIVLHEKGLAHDHIDSPVLGQLRLPRNPGLRTKICEALEVP